MKRNIKYCLFNKQREDDKMGPTRLKTKKNFTGS